MQKLDGFYEVSYDRGRKLLRITTYGFWNLDVVGQFGRAIAEVLQTADPLCDTLLNTCRTEIHTTEVTEALGRLSDLYKGSDVARVAIVSPSMLLRMQTKRMQNAEADYGYFETEEEALAWLATPVRSVTSQARAAG